MKQVSNTIASLGLRSPLHRSISQQTLFSKYRFVLLLAGFALFISSCQKDELQGNLQKQETQGNSQMQDLLNSSQKPDHKNKYVPFKGKFTLARTATGVILTGQGSHIGRFTLVSEGGATTITAANGDQIFGTRTVSGFQDIGNGMVQASFDNTITGGTGRFA